MKTYVVKPGDTLSGIAKAQLGDALRWPDLVRANQLRDPNRLYVGQVLQIERSTDIRCAQMGPSAFLGNPIPARVALARGFMFVVFEQLPDIGGRSVIRKVAVVPKDFSLMPRNPFGSMSLAEHAMGMNPSMSPYLSASNQPFGAPSIGGKPLLLDLAQIQKAGGRVFSIQEVVKDLQQFVKENPSAGPRVSKLIKTIQGVEGEILIKGGTPPGSAAPLSSVHTAYVRSAEDLWRSFTEGAMTRPQLEKELAALGKAYSRAKIVGNVGRGLMVIGVVFTAVDLGAATQQSIQQQSFKPVAAETIRQVGGWGGAIAGGKIGFGVGALFGIETGPGAIVTGAVGALIFGAAGYFGADWLADKVSPN